MGLWYQLQKSYTAEANNMWIIYAKESSLFINRTFRMCRIHYLRSAGTVNQLCQIFRTILKVVQQCVSTINHFRTLIEYLRKLKKSCCFLFSLFFLFSEKCFVTSISFNFPCRDINTSLIIIIRLLSPILIKLGQLIKTK